MFKKAATIAFLLSFGGQALASDDLARQMGIEPGLYTTNELVQILFADNPDRQIETIHRNRAAFQEAVRAAMGAAEVPVNSTRSAQ